VLLLPPAPPPVSYGREVAPILALHCEGCHGEAGGLNIATHRDLMRGGNMGKVIIAGDPARSLLIHFIDGRRGEAHRMPLGGRPLTPEQIKTIARWIAEGAKDDGVSPREHTFTLPRVRTEPGRTLRIVSRIETAAYLVLAIRHPESKRVLLTRSGSIKTPRDPGDLGEPGEPVSWDVRTERGWPRELIVELTVRYPSGPTGKPELRAELLEN
jgi:hypothetical protein